MTKDPWTDPDPQPGDFDAELETLGPDALEYHDGGEPATARIIVSLRGEDALRLAELAQARGKEPSAVVAELLRAANRSAA
jgi:hypothetical protein